ncbi:related to cytochrome P450 21 [Ramularia collo-cygni]|uniref:Related to cytochrome P450 21 n=1 Tax=Ramularia collo-cygni TaxID=112498 RepID=A0A2D3UMJ8_9PEZI|nr:related to cytochrome P450 21 [Ramularia collo-cygni]CZT15391.1 related to cytochrome P450 21 [Ramularia collo-cygni]
MWGADTLLMVSPQARREVMSTQAYSNFERPWPARKRLQTTTGNGLLVVEGEEHKFQRKGLLPAFSTQQIRSLAPVMWEKSAELIRVLREHVQNNPDEDVIIHNWVSHAALDIIGVASWGTDFCAVSQPQSRLVSKYRAAINPHKASLLDMLLLATLPLSVTLSLPTKRAKQIRQGQQEMRKAARHAVQERKQSGLEHRKDLLSVAMRSGVFTDEKLVETLLTFVAAGHETSATAAMWTCFHLACHPDVQSQLREQVRSQLPSPTAAASDAKINWDELEAIPLLRAVSLEAMRLSSPVAGLQRVAIRDTFIAGQVIPRGTNLVDNFWATSQLFCDRPEEFSPERWLGVDEDKRRNGAIGNFEYSMFSHGTRACIGQGFARLEQLALIAALVGSFELTCADHARPAVILGVTAAPVKPIKLRLRPLSGW